MSLVRLMRWCEKDPENLRFTLENGMDVEVTGEFLYIKGGSYQLYCNKMDQVGIGDLYVAFLRLKEKSLKRKAYLMRIERSLSHLPKKNRCNHLTNWAAIRDIINASTRRNKNCNRLIYPALAQGKGASQEIIKGIEYLNNIEDIDTIINC